MAVCPPRLSPGPRTKPLPIRAAAANPPPVVVFAEADAAAQGIELLAEPPSYDAPTSDERTTIEATATCSSTRPRGIDVVLSWRVDLPGKESHRVDLTMFRDGFATGRYLTSGELANTTSSDLLFEGALPGIYYYWRVLTNTSEGWIVSGNGRFDAPICPFDEAPE